MALEKRTKLEIEKTLENYDLMMKGKDGPDISSSSSVKKPKALEEASLIDLDRWIWRELPQTISERKPEPYITKQELELLMKWKLKRGKFRPRLQSLISSNADTTVRSCSKEAFHLLKEQCPYLLEERKDVQQLIKNATLQHKDKSIQGLKKSMDVLCALRGVGPATASAILMCFTDFIPFFSDESYHILNNRSLIKSNQDSGSKKLPSIKYTPKEYQEFLHQIYSIASKSLVYPKLVEKSLWTEFYLIQLGEEIDAFEKRKEDEDANNDDDHTQVEIKVAAKRMRK